jgi:hypothetical protein
LIEFELSKEVIRENICTLQMPNYWNAGFKVDQNAARLGLKLFEINRAPSLAR